MRGKTAVAVVVLLVMTSLLFAQPTEEIHGESGTISYTDDVGRTVILPRRLERILPAGLIAQYVLFPLCADSFVGVAAPWADSARGILADKYLALPLTGQIYGSKASFNLEEVLKGDPQVVIDVGERKKGMRENLDKLQGQLGIPVIHIDATNSSMDVAYEKMGKLLGKEEEARALGDYCARVLERTKATLERGKVRGIYVLGKKGVNVIARDSYQAEAINLLLDNVAVLENPSPKGSGNQVDMEQILTWNPDYVIFAHDAEEVYRGAKDDPIWSKVRAIRDGHYFLAPSVPQDWLGNPLSVNRFLGLSWAAKVIYGERCDYDLYEEVKTYFKLFYLADLSREQFNVIVKQ